MAEKKTKWITERPEDRIARDPRGLDRVTIVGGIIFREISIEEVINDAPDDTFQITPGQLATLDAAAETEGSI